MLAMKSVTFLALISIPIIVSFPTQNEDNNEAFLTKVHEKWNKIVGKIPGM